MTPEGQQDPLRSAADEALDRLLAGWAARHVLSAERAEAIRQTALRSRHSEQSYRLQATRSNELTQTGQLELNATWWRNLFGAMATTLQQATDVRQFLNATNRIKLDSSMNAS